MVGSAVEGPPPQFGLPQFGGPKRIGREASLGSRGKLLESIRARDRGADLSRSAVSLSLSSDSQHAQQSSCMFGYGPRRSIVDNYVTTGIDHAQMFCEDSGLDDLYSNDKTDVRIHAGSSEPTKANLMKPAEVSNQ